MLAVLCVSFESLDKDCDISDLIGCTYYALKGLNSNGVVALKGRLWRNLICAPEKCQTCPVQMSKPIAPMPIASMPYL